MDLLTIIYLGFIFASLYLSVFFLIIYYKNKEKLFEVEELKEFPSLSVLIPAFNEEDTIQDTIKAVLNSDYPKDKLDILVINDGSTDKTLERAREFDVRVLDKKNSGKADSLNQALEMVDSEFVAVVDADSYPVENAFKNIISHFNEKTGGVTSCILVKNPKNLLEKMQSAEYTFISWARKLLEFIGCVYVTPGALSIYRSKALKGVGGFDTKNMTEDIEITWRLLRNKYEIGMCLAAKVFTVPPKKFMQYWRQRLRWHLGGLQTFLKYKNTLFNNKFGSLGLFISPFFGISLILSLTGLSFFSYIILRRLIHSVLLTKSLISTSSFGWYINSLGITPSVFTFFWLSLFAVTLVYVYSCYKSMKVRFNFNNSFILLSYLLVYVALNPFILVHAMWRYTTGNMQW